MAVRYRIRLHQRDASRVAMVRYCGDLFVNIGHHAVELYPNDTDREQRHAKLQKRARYREDVQAVVQAIS